MTVVKLLSRKKTFVIFNKNQSFRSTDVNPYILELYQFFQKISASTNRFEIQELQQIGN